jgi:hypothetical protein
MNEPYNTVDNHCPLSYNRIMETDQYALEWQWFIDGQINCHGFERLLYLKYGISPQCAANEFALRWGKFSMPCDLILKTPDDQLLALYNVQ